jgi:hypothetical protein
MNTRELESRNWLYPTKDMEVDLLDMFSTSRPWPTYPPFRSAWVDGTTLEDEVARGFPFTNLFDTPPANGHGYTHKESK